MNGRSNKFCRGWQRSGFALIEVVVGLALLGSLLSVLLVAHSRQLLQTRRAQARLMAVAALDAWLVEHHQRLDELARSGRGTLAENSEYEWKATVLEQPELKSIAARVLRIEVFGKERDGALCSVELLMAVNEGEQ